MSLDRQLPDAAPQIEEMSNRMDGLPDPYIAPPAAKQKRLSLQQLRIARDLHREGKTQVFIAELLGVSQPAISQALKAIGDDTTDLAQDRAKATAYRRRALVDRIVQKNLDKNPDVALKAIKHEDAIAGLAVENKGVGAIALKVDVGMPGQPAGPDPLAGMTITTEAKVIGESSQEGRG